MQVPSSRTQQISLPSEWGKSRARSRGVFPDHLQTIARRLAYRDENASRTNGDFQAPHQQGGPKGDLEALTTAISAIAAYVTENAAKLEELDINPIMVLPQGLGTVAVDALIRRRK